MKRNIMDRAVGKMKDVTVRFLRKQYYQRKRNRLTNPAPTIIANNCFGSFIYHNLGLRFNSPTINLFFHDADFVMFVKDLRGYLNAELVNTPDPERNYPVGTLEYNGKKVTVYFMHYSGFEEAKEKWDMRKARVDFANISVILQTVHPAQQVEKAFFELPYENKVLIAAENPRNCEKVCVLPILNKKGYRPGEVLEYGSHVAIRRHMDEFDYVAFLNGTGQARKS